MAKPDPLLFMLQKLSVSFASIDRRLYFPGEDRFENDVEHSYAIALVCWYIIESNNIELDITKVFKYALAHDLVEVYAGDVNTFASPADRAKKVERENKAAIRLSNEFAKFPDMVQIIQSYELKEDEESKFVWTVDKMQALIISDIDNWRPHREIGIDFQAFSDKYVELFPMSSKYLKEIFTELIEYSKTTYYDQPKSQS